MAKMCLSKPSKRLTCRKRYKIEKKVKEHNRKLRKENKKKQNKVNRKPIVVPNVCPFKDKILAEVEALKVQQEEEREKRRAEIREQRMQQKEGEMAGGLKGLVENAETRRLLHEQSNNFGIGPGLFTDITAKTFYKEFKKVVSRADVILEVLDARDPLGTRCLAVEREIMRNPGKRLVIVLNKADLVPRDVLQSWLKYLRHSFPAVPFKASTQEQGSRLGRRGGRKGKMSASLSQAELEGSPCVGAELLLSLLGNYCRNKDIKTSIVVGVVGNAEIVQEHAKEFDMSELSKLEKEAMTDFIKIAPQEAMVIESEGPVTPLVEDQQPSKPEVAMEESGSEDDEQPPQLVEAPEL
ncbi:hypothetical protein B566_EDAN017936, partial [Ephemera danica]